MNAPAELFHGHRMAAHEAAVWVLAALLALAAHAAFAYALRDMTPFTPMSQAQEQALEIDLAPLPVSQPDSVESEMIAAEQPVETMQPDEDMTEPVPTEPEKQAALEAEPLQETPTEAVSETPPDDPAAAQETETNEAAAPEPDTAEPRPDTTPEAEPETAEQAEPDRQPVTSAETEMAEQETVEAVDPEVVLPLQAAVPETREPEEKAEPPRKRPVERRRKVEREQPKKEAAKPRRARETEIAEKADKGPARSQPSVASQKSKASSAPNVSPERWNSAVRAAVARSVGRIRGMRGSVNVSFVVSSSGGVVSARVSRSSGNDRLDGAALSAVRSARVPAPPPGLGGSSHAFSVPLTFY